MQIARGRRLYYFADEGVVEIQRISFEQGIFHICHIVQITSFTPLFAQREAPAACAHSCCAA